MTITRTDILVALFNLVLGLAGLFLACSGALADMERPTLYKVNGKPINPMCLELFSIGQKMHDTVNLKNYAQEDIVEAGRDGETGFMYRYKDADPDDRGGDFTYDYVGRLNGVDIFSFFEWTGGSGHFTSLVGIIRKGDTLTLKKFYTGGDRCNGGIEDASIKQGRLIYTQSVTPYDMIKLGNPDTGVAAYSDLENSAASCIASAAYTDGQFSGLSIGTDRLSDVDGWTDQYRYQACFNRLFNDYAARGKASLSTKEVVQFAAEFQAECARK